MIMKEIAPKKEKVIPQRIEVKGIDTARHMDPESGI